MKLQILVVDDYAMIRESLCLLLETGGHQVTEASNLPEAIRLLETECFDVVITDNDMPIKDEGLRLIRYARSLANSPKVIWMSGRALTDPSLADQARAEGACEILAKPFSFVELSGMIAQIQASRQSKLEETVHT